MSFGFLYDAKFILSINNIKVYAFIYFVYFVFLDIKILSAIKTREKYASLLFFIDYIIILILCVFHDNRTHALAYVLAGVGASFEAIKYFSP